MSPSGKFNVILPATSSPKRTYPKNPMTAYSTITVPMATFNTPGHPKKS